MTVKKFSADIGQLGKKRIKTNFTTARWSWSITLCSNDNLEMISELMLYDTIQFKSSKKGDQRCLQHLYWGIKILV